MSSSSDLLSFRRKHPPLAVGSYSDKLVDVSSEFRFGKFN